MLLGVAYVVFAAAVSTAAFWLIKSKRMSVGNGVGLAVVLLWLAGAGAKIAYDRQGPSDEVTAMLQSMKSVNWTAGTDARDTQASLPSNVAPVASLIGGLEARLAEQPDDSKGWALLAQSYSFIGNTEAAERAAARAIELGFDESELRTRVDAARREAHPGISATGAVGG